MLKNLRRIASASIAATFYISASGTALPDGNHAPIGEAIKDVPIFDAHIHYKEPAWEAYPVKSVIELMDENGVAMGLVSSTPDEGTIMLYEYAPNRIVPELRPYHGDAGSGNWMKAQGMEAYIKERLEKYPHEGIGEFHIHNLDPTDEPLLRSVAKMASERGILIHLHSGAEPVRLMHRLDPNIKMIWAHAGMSEPAKLVAEVMREFPRLYADMSFRENDVLPVGGEIDPQWREIVMEFQDRLMVGSDTWVNSQWDHYSYLIDYNRRWLSHFPRSVVEKIAYKNAEILFNRKISMDLIGKR